MIRKISNKPHIYEVKGPKTSGPSNVVKSVTEGPEVLGPSAKHVTMPEGPNGLGLFASSVRDFFVLLHIYCVSFA